MKTITTLLLCVVCSIASSQTTLLDKAKKLVYSDPVHAVEIVQEYLPQEGYYSAKAYALAAKAYEEQGHYATAYNSYTSGLNRLYASDTLDHYLEYAMFNNMAMIAAESNQYDISADLYLKAAEAAERYIKYEPETAEQYNEQYLVNKMMFYRGNALYDAGNLDAALDVYLELDKQFFKEVKDPSTFALLRNEYGLNAKSAGDYLEAAYNFRSIIEMEAVSGYYKQSAQHNLALVMQEKGEIDSALNSFDAAIDIEGATDLQYYISYMDKGELLLEQQRYAESIEVFNKALSLDVDLTHDLRLMNIHYLLERAYKSIDLDSSNYYGDKYQMLVADHLRMQSEIIAQEKARAFSLSLNQSKHEQKIKELEDRHLKRLIINILLFVLISIIVGYLYAWLRIKLRIRKTISQ